MPKYRIGWAKTYHVSGESIVEANSMSLAESIAHDKIGDWEGSMQYDPDEDRINYIEKIKEK